MRKLEEMGIKKSYCYISTDGSGKGMVIASLKESFEPNDVEERDGVTYKRVDELHIDVSLISDIERKELANGAIELVREQMKDPDYERKFQEWLEKRRSQEIASEDE